MSLLLLKLFPLHDQAAIWAIRLVNNSNKPDTLNHISRSILHELMDSMEMKETNKELLGKRRKHRKDITLHIDYFEEIL